MSPSTGLTEPADCATSPNPRGKWRGRRCFLLLAFLAAGAAFAEEPLDTVIDRLADEDVVTREDAERALVARGAGVLKSLERRRVNCSWNDA